MSHPVASGFFHRPEWRGAIFVCEAPGAASPAARQDAGRHSDRGREFHAFFRDGAALSLVGVLRGYVALRTEQPDDTELHAGSLQQVHLS